MALGSPAVTVSVPLSPVSQCGWVQDFAENRGRKSG